MKLIAMILLGSVFAGAAPLKVEMAAYGPWTLCSVDTRYCVPGAESYMVTMKPSGVDVLAFRVRLRYVQRGVEKTWSGYVERGPEEYTSIVDIKLGLIDYPLSVEADELVVK